MIKRIKENYKQADSIGCAYNWDYKPNLGVNQLKHNKSLVSLICKRIEECDLNIIITSPEICTIFDSNYENFQIAELSEDFTSEINKDFEPMFIIVDNVKKIGLVIKDETIFDKIIFTDSYGAKMCKIIVDNLPKVNLVDCF